MVSPPETDLTSRFAVALRGVRPDIALSVLGMILESDLRQVLPRVQQPCQVIQTRSDPAVPLEAAEMLSHLSPQERLVYLDAHGHLPDLSDAARVIEVIQAFL